MTLDTRETIFARSSGAGRAGVAVFRVSGPRAGVVLDTFCGGRGEPRTARLARIVLRDGSLLDTGLTLWFPGPASFTGEDVAEFHLHGSPAVERAFEEAMVRDGLAPASAGAFTMRAFEAGKLDLTQAEGLGDLLDAETEGQRRQALGQLGGRLADRAAVWRGLVLSAMGSLEAAIDFPDEDDVPVGIEGRARTALEELREELRSALEGAGQARQIRDGVTVALTGPPNAGKSSILNRLAGSDRAIVSDQAGTTRDTLEVRLDLGGTLVTLIDTAGIREATDDIERQGIERALKAAGDADIRVEVRDVREAAGTALSAPHTIFVANKIDTSRTTAPNGWIALSAKTGAGWSDFERALSDAVAAGGGGVLTRERHVSLVRFAAGRIEALLMSEPPPEVAGEDLRLVLRSFDELTGRIAPDDVLGEIFSSFCIGK